MSPRPFVHLPPCPKVTSFFRDRDSKVDRTVSRPGSNAEQQHPLILIKIIYTSIIIGNTSCVVALHPSDQQGRLTDRHYRWIPSSSPIYLLSQFTTRKMAYRSRTMLAFSPNNPQLVKLPCSLPVLVRCDRGLKLISLLVIDAPRVSSYRPKTTSPPPVGLHSFPRQHVR